MVGYAVILGYLIYQPMKTIGCVQKLDISIFLTGYCAISLNKHLYAVSDLKQKYFLIAISSKLLTFN